MTCHYRCRLVDVAPILYSNWARPGIRSSRATLSSRITSLMRFYYAPIKFLDGFIVWPFGKVYNHFPVRNEQWKEQSTLPSWQMNDEVSMGIPQHHLAMMSESFDLLPTCSLKPIWYTLPKRSKLLNRQEICRSIVKTMSEVIREESVAVKIGCLAGPIWVKNWRQRQPAATVVASHFNEVIQTGKNFWRVIDSRYIENNDIVV